MLQWRSLLMIVRQVLNTLEKTEMTAVNRRLSDLALLSLCWGLTLITYGCAWSASGQFPIAALLSGGVVQTDAARLRQLLASNNVTPLESSTSTGASIKLGEALFFDKIISGPKNISCATCHHPSLVAGDGLTLPIGAGGSGIGGNRLMGNGSVIIHRNAPEIHNRTTKGWAAFFWDGRVEEVSPGVYNTPAGKANAKLPSGLKNIAAVQAIFPMISRTEMLGFNGGPNDNDLAKIDVSGDPESAWNRIMDRLRANPAYVTLLQNAYPGVDVNLMGIEYAANAIADYEGDLWNTTLATGWTISAFNSFLTGKDEALNESALRGGLLFFGSAGCSGCHTGPHLSDMEFHNIAVPQLGPGFGSGASLNPPRDFGRFEVTGNDADRYRFRTAPLREVPYTGPYMHNGAFANLSAVLKHHLNPSASLSDYNPSLVPSPYSSLVNTDASLKEDLLARLDPELKPRNLTERETADLLEFLSSLGSPTTLLLNGRVPSDVPSGLPVDR